MSSATLARRATGLQLRATRLIRACGIVGSRCRANSKRAARRATLPSERLRARPMSAGSGWRTTDPHARLPEKASPTTILGTLVPLFAKLSLLSARPRDHRRAWRGNATRARVYFGGYVTVKRQTHWR